MSARSWSSDTARLVSAADSGLVEGNLVAVSSADLAQQSAGILLRNSGLSRDQRPVRIVPVPRLSAGTVAISDDLADDLGMRGDSIRWQLNQEHAQQASVLVLESLTEGRLKELADLLTGARNLSGQVFFLDEGGVAAWVYPDGTPFRVRSACDAHGRALRGLVQVGSDTRMDLIAPGHRTGVDIVILADCSGSMRLDDIEQRAGGRYVTRMEALKRALARMIDIRAHTAGRVSRIALVAFADYVRCVFPPQDGMVELNGAGDPRALDEFRQAVGLLTAKGPRTDIGQALHFAAELLHRQGVPDNDRLIVLVSDGAEWNPKSEDLTGEAVVAVSDPVSLMEELESSLAIKLHAIGIGDERSFHAWWERFQRAQRGDPPPKFVPNHKLLERLVTVGGGDPRRVGGLEVLQEYFSGLGEGVTRHVGKPAKADLRPMQAALETLAEPTGGEDVDVSRARIVLADRARELRPVCVKLSIRCGAKPIYRGERDFTNKLHRLDRKLGNEDDFRAWILDLNQIFQEDLESRLRAPNPPKPYDLPAVAGLIRDGRLNEIRLVRNWAAHDTLSTDDEMEIGRIMTRFAGLKYIDHGDARRWAKLQLSLLKSLVGLLEEVRQALEEEPVPPPKQQPAGLRATPLIDGYR